ncbi:mitochondrial ribosomal large subunit component [Trapelia coarctata]|nr:mitochondrial ribosomal large subunit component [Trapelia coarctata]
MKPRISQLYRQPLSGFACLRRSPLCVPQYPLLTTLRAFSSTPSHFNWLAPRRGIKNQKSRKGRPRVPTGGSMRGTTIVWGDYGLRMRDHDRRLPASALAIGMETIKRRLRGLKYKLYTRINANIPVFTSGNEVRMGKGKGSFDFWAARVAVSKIIFELKGELHEQVIRDAFRLAAAKMPGLYEIVKKGDPPVMGITKVPEGVTLEDMKRPRMPPKEPLPLEATAARLPAAAP